LRKLVYLIPLILILITCKGTTSPDQEDFSLTINVQDAGGNPISDLVVNVVNLIPGFGEWEYSRPQTTIFLVLIEQAQVELNIYDIERQHVKELISNTMEAGNWSVNWDGRDANDELCMPGIYYYSIEIYEENDLVFENEKLMYFYEFSNELFAIGRTDLEGAIFTDDTKLFPNFYDLPEIVRTDEEGNNLGTFAITDSVIIILTDPDTDASQNFVIVIDEGAQALDLIWETEENILEQENTGFQTIISDRDADDEIIPRQYWMTQNYPNPFN